MSESCCDINDELEEEKKLDKLSQEINSGRQNHHHEDHHHGGHNHEHNHEHGGRLWRLFSPVIISTLLLLTGLALDHGTTSAWFHGWVRVVWYLIAYLPVGIPVMKEAYESIRNGDVFSEFFLMSIATIGAFAIQVYPEAVGVMLFYSLGEIFQTLALTKARNNVKDLIDQRPDVVHVLQDNKLVEVRAKDTRVDQIIQLKPGERLALDGILLSTQGSFDTSALTGESVPDTKHRGEQIWAGMINLQSLVEIKINREYKDSKLSQILNMVQDAVAHKAPTELFIRKFARVYTPIVVILAIAICLLPILFVTHYVFSEWLYRALIFLVISCPCALVISIPLGYFGGIGAASRNGILFKGSNYLDALAKINQVVVDKTGTMTEGVFKVQEFHIQPEFDKDDILRMVNALESKSTHPIATAIHEYVGEIDNEIDLRDVNEVTGLGLKCIINGKELLVGNLKLLEKYKISYDQNIQSIPLTLLALAYGGVYVGYLTIADQIKAGAAISVEELKRLGVPTTMLSGDKSTVVGWVADKLKIDRYWGDLLPEDKVSLVKKIQAENQSVAFVGDGVNDAPVIALSDVGMAMGALGSDAAIETAHVVIQDDLPTKIPMAIRISRETKKIVWQNITLAFVVKALVLIMGASGLATMWEAVFADVGVALLAILNAIRIQRKKF